MRHGNLFVISGPSGAGKGTLVARLLREVPDAWVSRSVTTRAPREGEVDGVHYQFASDEEFQVRDKFPSAHLVFIEPPSLRVLEERLRGRGTEGDEVIEARMKAAEVELSHKMEYDMWLVNDNLDEATDALVRYVNEQAEKARG